jgi:AcrR family transcriptional regulator
VTDRKRQILDAALDLADAHGLAAVSMRAVAARVGMTPMALYPYVGSKAALLDGMVDRLLGELSLPDRTLDWRERLRLVAHGARRLARQHPAAFPLLFARPAVTPDAVRVVDSLYQALLDAGVPARSVDRVERMVSTFVLGFAVSEVNGRFSPGSVARAERINVAPEELPGHRALQPWLEPSVDWDAEFDADLADLARMVESVVG